MICSSRQYGEYQYALARPLKRRRNHVRKGQGCHTLVRSLRSPVVCAKLSCVDEGILQATCAVFFDSGKK